MLSRIRYVKVSRPAWSQDHIFGLGLMKYWSRSHERWSRGLLSQWLPLKSKSSYLASTSKVISKCLCMSLTINRISNWVLFWDILLVLILPNFLFLHYPCNQTGLGLIVFGPGLTRQVWSQSHSLVSVSLCYGLIKKPVMNKETLLQFLFTIKFNCKL